MLSGTLISHFLCFSIGFPMVWVTNILNHFFFDQEVATETLRNLLGVLVSTNILGFMPKVPETLMMGVEQIGNSVYIESVFCSKSSCCCFLIHVGILIDSKKGFFLESIDT